MTGKPTRGPTSGTSDVVSAVGGIVVDERGRLLLIRRAHAPGAGLWSLPGGRVEAGEDDATALRREMLEETGLVVAVDDPVGHVERAGVGSTVFAITDYRCRVISGRPVAGTDADAIGWFGPDELAQLPLVGLLLETLREWGVV